MAAAKALAAFWKGSGATGAKGNLGLDALALAARTGEKVDLTPHAVWVQAAMAELPGVRALTVDVLPYDDRAAGHTGELRAGLARAGTPIGPYDQLIAGLARARGLIVITNNRREFDRVPGLRVEDWTG